MFAMFIITAIPVFLILSVSIFRAFPRSARNFFAYNTALGVLLNLGISSGILLFTGVAVFAGVSNIAASILFGWYLVLYKKYHGITGVEWKNRGPFKLKVIPMPVFREENRELEGIKKAIF